jgi:hypothetical protein
VWGIVVGHILREDTFAGVEALVRSRARRALAVGQGFGNDALAYFTARLAARPTRASLAGVLRWAKRSKAFGGTGWIGLAVDGTTTSCCAKRRCRYCRPQRDDQQRLLGYRHHVVLLSVVGSAVPLPCDVELYGPGDSEYAAALRVLKRGVRVLGPRFADYIVADGQFAHARFLHVVEDLGLHAVVRLKENLPELFEAAQQLLLCHVALILAMLGKIFGPSSFPLGSPGSQSQEKGHSTDQDERGNNSHPETATNRDGRFGRGANAGRKSELRDGKQRQYTPAAGASQAASHGSRALKTSEYEEHLALLYNTRSVERKWQ